MALSKALGTDLSSLAKIIQSKGRGRDTVLAHITPQEAALLKRRGGRGSINPNTGLPEFEDDFAGDISVVSGGEQQTPAQVAAANPDLYAGGQAPSAGQDTTFVPASESGPSTVEYQPITPTTTPTGAEQIYDRAPTQNLMYSPGIQPYAINPDTLQALPGVTPTAKTETPDQTGFLDKALASLGKPETLGRLGLAGALGAYGALQGKQAQTQNEAATAQKQAIAQPYQQQGQELVRAAQAGELTPANQQVIQQQRARLAQASANMGGVGQQQIENQISSLTAQLLQNQYQYGLQVMQIGDNIALGAINTQLQLDQQLNAANKSYYTGLAQLVAGSPTYITQTKVGA
jgi:hypothetical protein